MNPEAPRNRLGEDVVPVPPPLDPHRPPPVDRYCDLVLTGGVASGVVYPWAVLELARHYRFRSIGGTSVGAMAAALAAAAEYGRRTGWPHAFEVLRRAPGALAEETNGISQLQALFEPGPGGKRLFSLFLCMVRRRGENASPADNGKDDQRLRTGGRGRGVDWTALLGCALRLYALWPAAIALVPLALLFRWCPPWFPFAVGLSPLVVLVAALLWLRYDLRHGLAEHDLGLCNGQALVAWLHDKVQRAAGLAPNARPLSFRDLWRAPLWPGADRTDIGEGSPAGERSIDLQMMTTNVTLGRPLRLPLQERGTQLLFDPVELGRFLPETVLAELVRVSQAYVPPPQAGPHPHRKPDRPLRVLPGADLPVVVAARLSLSFPLLFSAVPLYSVDEPTPDQQGPWPERCWFSDGGLCSNFPVHLFDAAIPRWPTFGLWLGDRTPYHPATPCTLPPAFRPGGDELRRHFEGEDAERWPDAKPPRQGDQLLGFLQALALTSKDWGDYTRMRMPHVRNRVARLALFAGEGGLNIAMSRQTMLEMAHEYGTAAGKAFVQHYGAKDDLLPAQYWSEQRWARLQVLVDGLRDFVCDMAGAAGTQAYSSSLDRLIADVIAGKATAGDMAQWRDRPASADEARDYERLLKALVALDASLAETPLAEPYRSDPPVELRLRPIL